MTYPFLSRSFAPICTIAAVAIALTAAIDSRADVLVDYQFNTNNFSSIVANGGAATNLVAPYSTVTNSSYLSSATAIDNGGTAVALTYRLSGTLVNNPGSAAAYPEMDARLTSTAPSPTLYFQFSMVANTAFNLNTLQFDLATGANSTTTVRGADVQYSLDGFTTETDLGTNGVVGNADVFSHFSLDMANAAVANGQTISFRFLPFVNTGAAGGVRFDNIEVDGSVVTAPEPSSLALLGASALAFLAKKRSRK